MHECTGDPIRRSPGTTVRREPDPARGSGRPLFDAAAGTTYYFMVGTYRNRRGGDIRFRVAEAPPPPIVAMSVDRIVTVNSQTEEVTVTGTLACDSDSEYTEFYGSARQPDGRRFISAFFYVFGDDIVCDGTQHPWSVTELGDGIFVDGPGLVDAEAYTCSSVECVEHDEVVRHDRKAVARPKMADNSSPLR